jgi:prepilin-type N-terminal cleavage/methylation domain-containing protein/prepilin-type processing-associated H-X9-DG protein
MRRAAFTLVEMLVVISILAMLATLLFPVFASVRARARTVTCQANLQQLLLSLQNYEAEHQSLPCGFEPGRAPPPPGGYQGNPAFDFPGWWWFDFAGVVRYRTQAGIEETKVLRCPARRIAEPALNRSVLVGNYGVNRALCRNETCLAGTPVQKAFVGAPLSTGNLSHPGSTLLLVDSGYSLICWWQATAEPPAPVGDEYMEDTSYVPGLEINKDRNLWPGQSADAISGRHPNKTVNVGFADGHTECRKASELLVEKAEAGYTNSLLWHAPRVPPPATIPP